ncbi:unnamed protein product [Closterium sp. NIES-53]
MVEAAVVVFGVELLRGEDLAVARGTAAPSERDPYAPAASYGVDIFGLDYDAILVAMYALSVSAEGDCYLCLPPDPGIAAAALGASESALPGTAPVEALHTFTLDSDWLTPQKAQFLPIPPVFSRVRRFCSAHSAARRSSLLLVSPDDSSPADSPHGHGEVPDGLIPWIRALRLQLRERFCEDLPVLRLHSHRGGEFSSDLLRDFCRGEGILQLFTLPTSSQQNRVAERRIGLVMEVACTSMIHAAAPHFLWPFAVRYAAHQLNLCPRVSLPETSPTLHSPLPAPSPYAEQTDSFTERRERESRPTSPVRAVRTGRCVLPLRPPPVPGTYVMALQRNVPLARAASPTVPHLLSTFATDPSFDSTAASTLVAQLLDFGAACRLDYATSLEDFECLAAAVPHLVAMLLAPEGDPDAPDIPNPRSYTEAITVPPFGANIVDGMWIFMVKWPSGSLHVFKARYRDYELHSLDFSTAFLQGSLHEEISLRRPPGFTGSFPAVLVYVDDSVFATATTEAMALVKSELQKRHTCTDLGELRSYLGLHITRDRARCTITLTQSPMEAAKRVLRYLWSFSGMGLVLGGRGPLVLIGHADASSVDDLAMQRSSQGYTFNLCSGSVSWRSTRSSSVLSSSCEAEIYAGAMAAQEFAGSPTC